MIILIHFVVMLVLSAKSGIIRAVLVETLASMQVFAAKRAAICFAALHAEPIYLAGSAVSLGSQQRNSSGSCFRLPASVGSIRRLSRESGTPCRSWLGLVSLECFRGGCCADI